jgi:hypothetical protein
MFFFSFFFIRIFVTKKLGKFSQKIPKLVELTGEKQKIPKKIKNCFAENKILEGTLSVWGK